MKIIFGRGGLRGGKADSDASVVTSFNLTGSNGEMNWSKLKREIEKAIEEVRSDSQTPSLVSRIDIQIQR